VFRVATNGTFTTLAWFANTNGSEPQAGLTQGTDGNLYGTTSAGGAYTNQSGSGYGTVFRLDTNNVITTLLSFDGTNGAAPLAGLLEAGRGVFYGTTSSGGRFNHGTLFRLSPSAPVRPVIQTVSRGTGSIVMTWSTVAGQKYQVQSIANANQTNWSDRGQALIAPGDSLTATNSTASASRQFYRIVLIQ